MELEPAVPWLESAANEDPKTCCIRCVNAWLLIDGNLCGSIASCCSAAMGASNCKVFAVDPKALAINGSGKVCPWYEPKRYCTFPLRSSTMSDTRPNAPSCA